MKSKMDYEELKKEYQKNIDSLHFMVGFSKEWFEELMKLKQNHGKVYNIWGSCYADESNYQKLCQFSKDFEEYKENKLKEQDEKFIVGAIKYEMSNNEYVLTYDTEEVMNSLGFKMELFNDKRFRKVWDKAEKKYLAWCYL